MPDPHAALNTLRLTIANSLSTNGTHAHGVVTRFVPMLKTLLTGNCQNTESNILGYFAQPRLLASATVFSGAYASVFTALMSLGFGTQGIAGGAMAARFQSVHYGASVPAGGWFATLTSMGMLGTFSTFAAILAFPPALVVTRMVWAAKFWQ